MLILILAFLPAWMGFNCKSTSATIADKDLECGNPDISLAKETLCCIQFARNGSKDGAGNIVMCRGLTLERNKRLAIQRKTKSREYCKKEVIAAQKGLKLPYTVDQHKFLSKTYTACEAEIAPD